MYERTLQSAARYLSLLPRSRAPMKTVWRSVCSEAALAPFESCSLADFAALLDADPRFAITGNGFDEAEFDPDMWMEEDRSLFELGFSPTCMVQLVGTREPDDDDDEEMPSIAMKHLSETKRVRRSAGRTPRPDETASKPKRGKATRPSSRRGRRRPT